MNIQDIYIYVYIYIRQGHSNKQYQQCGNKKITFKNGIFFYRIALFLTLMSVKVTNNIKKKTVYKKIQPT